MAQKKIKKQPYQKSELRKVIENLAMNLDKIEELKKRTPKEFLSIIQFQDNHTHFVFPDNDGTTKDLLLSAMAEKDFLRTLTHPATQESPPKLPSKIVFHNRQAIGDILMFTCAIRDIKKAFPNIQLQVQSTAMHIWEYNPNVNTETWLDIIDPISLNQTGRKPTDAEMIELNKKAIALSIEEDRPAKIYIGPGIATNASNRVDRHFANAFRISMETNLGVTIPQGPIRPDIYMAEQEYNKPPLIEPPYWIITAGEKGDWTCKTYPFSFWETVVTSMPEIKFVQIGSLGHKHPKLDGPNVINYIGKTEDRHTGIRNLFNLFNYCDGSMGLVSFQMHLAAAFNKPAIVIAGAREPVWFTRYPGQQYLTTDGCLPCTIKDNGEPVSCWFCDIKRCTFKETHNGQEVPKCASLIKPEEVINAIKRYYDGGRLNISKPIGRSKLVKLIKAELSATAPVKASTQITGDKSLWGFAWGGSSITDKDWEFMTAILTKEKVKRVLEFGSGLSTLLIKSMGIEVISFETRQDDIDRLKKINPTVDIRLWDGKEGFELGEDEKFDLVFIDGPGGGKNRETSFFIAETKADKILVHDGGRAPEKEWTEKHLKPKFMEHSRGGHRTIFFKLAKAIKETQNKIEVALATTDKPRLRVVFNGRGDGGAEHSTNWIMDQFVQKGWSVEYVSPNPQPSGTFRREGNSEVAFTSDLARIKEPCELLLLYVNDWVWEFKKLNDVFDPLQAKRKVMAVNYRLGDIGAQLTAPWTLKWDKYLFLNSSLQASFHERVVQATTKAMAPPADLSEYFKIQPNYNGNLRIVRHSSQGDVKYPKDFNAKIATILKEIPNSEIFLMPAPSFLEYPPSCNGRVHKHQRNQPSVKDFLAQGNVFWYYLPEGYTDMGPKVIMEAQAAGLAIVADNHSGAKDRVIGNTGVLCDTFSQHLAALKVYAKGLGDLEGAGKAAREHARKEYDPQNWIKEIMG